MLWLLQNNPCHRLLAACVWKTLQCTQLVNIFGHKNGNLDGNALTWRKMEKEGLFACWTLGAEMAEGGTTGFPRIGRL